MISRPIEHNDPTPSPNFEFPVFEAEEDDVEEIPDEITRLLEHEEKIISRISKTWKQSTWDLKIVSAW